MSKKISPQILERLERELDEQIEQELWIVEMFGIHNLRSPWRVPDCRLLLEAVKELTK